MWVYVAAEATGDLLISDLVRSWLTLHGLNILIILVGAWVLRRIGTLFFSQLFRHTVRRDLFPSEAERKKRIDTLNSLVGATVRISVTLIAAIMIIGELGINTAPLLASAGVLGVALGFGAQSLIKDFVTGIFIITENQYRVGDIVQIGTVSGMLGTVTGTIEAISIRTTVLRDMDGNLLHVPNGSINVTVNKTIGHSQINEDIVVGLNTDVGQLEHIVNHVGEELATMPQLQSKIKIPPYLARVEGFGDDGLIIKIQGRTTPGDQWRVKSELYKKLLSAFAQHHITVASHDFTTSTPKKAKNK